MVTSFTSGKARLRPLLRPAYESVPKSAVDRRADIDQCLLLRGRDLAGRLAAPATAADDGGRRTPRRTGHEDAGPAGRIFHGHADWAQCRSEEHTSELQSQSNLVCRLLLEKKKATTPPAL